MALVPFNSSLVELDAVSEFLSLGSLAAMVESQKQLFHSQIDHLERLVVKQCQLTGVNPLSQEMAAGAFSINIGKRPKDLLNPKAVKHMQSVFSLKDNIGKREAREISALCGITVRQVNEFFTSQRSKVRKLVRLSREKAFRLESSSKPPLEVLSTNTESVSASISAQQQEGLSVKPDPVDASRPVQEDETSCASISVRTEVLCASISAQNDALMAASRAVREADAALWPVQKDGVDLSPEAVGALRSVQKDGVGSVRSVQNDGVGALRSVQNDGVGSLRSVQNDGVGALRTVQKECDVGGLKEIGDKEGEKEGEGGLKEEDKKIVEDLVGLMNKETGFSGQVRLMESLLRINDEVALRWFLAKEGLSILLAWLGEAAAEEQTSVILVIFKILCHLPLNKAPTQISSILQAINRLRFYRTSDISSRAKMLLGKWSKLLRSQLVKKNPNDSQKDLIRKQRIRELLHGQSWNSEVGFPDDILALAENGDVKLAENKKTFRLLNVPYEDLTKKNGTSPSVLKNKVRRKVLLVDQQPNRNSLSTTRVARTLHPTTSRPLSTDDIQKAKLRASWQKQKHGVTKSEEKVNVPPVQVKKEKPVPAVRSVEQPDIDPMNLTERLNRAKICWRVPPEVKIDPAWQVSTGQNSKELSVQSQRIRRGSETFYPDPVTIPPNPKDPWDKELDFDDSLTPQIPLDPPSDPNPDPNPVGSEPDMELLAVLLKNPDLVFALTSGERSGLSGDQMVALLDRLKSSGLSLADLANGLADNKGSASGSESLPGSFPSPTPPAPLERANWKSDFHTATQPTVLSSPVVSPPVVSNTNHYNTLVSAINVQQNQSNVLSHPQMTVSMNPPAQHFTSVNAMQNPYLGQNASNHQNMQNFVPSHQHWDQNVGYLHAQNGYNSNSSNNTVHLMPGLQNQNPDVWGQGGIGESSAVWGYNGQRNYNNGQNWRR